MKKKRIYKVLLSLTAVTLAMFIQGCGSTDKDGSSDVGGSSDGGGMIAEEEIKGDAELEEMVPEGGELPEDGDRDGDIENVIQEAESYIGKPVSELLEACGGPSSTEYEDSPDTGGKVGFYYYDGFTVSTQVSEDGTEIVEGVW